MATPTLDSSAAGSAPPRAGGSGVRRLRDLPTHFAAIVLAALALIAAAPADADEQRAQVPASSVQLVAQAADAKDVIAGRVPCGTVMLYNEYWSLLRAGFRANELMVVRFGEIGLGMLEDGLYVRRASLEDPDFRRRLAALVKAVAHGWQQARELPDEAVALTLAKAPGLDAAQQRRMLESILTLIPANRPFGLLAIADYERTIDIYTRGRSDAEHIRSAAVGGWTHQVWYDIGTAGGDSLTQATRYYLAQSMGSTWFYLLDLIGTAAFGLAGFMRAHQRRYNIWGAFVLTLLPAVGGGTLRDVLVGGERHPPFIFQDPVYLYVVLGVVVVGTMSSRLLPRGFTRSRLFENSLAIFDTLGMAAFTLVGAKVALLAGLAWYWIPVCAALTCAGGGMLLDVVTGREPRTFLGEPYEEIAVFGGLLLYACLLLANRYEYASWLVTAAIVFTFLTVYAARSVVIVKKARSYRLGEPPGGHRAARERAA